ncbi:MAG: ABC transporter permease [Paludibacter sp.]|nr:ABC transporter permease [Paludibacter sp.]
MNSSKYFSEKNDKWTSIVKDIFAILRNEFKTVFRDRGVVIVFIIASIVYPLLYCGLYMNETLVNVPIAVVDASNTSQSRDLIRKMNATPDVEVAAKYGSMRDAKTAFESKEVHGIFYIPEDFDKNLVSGQQVNVSIYCDMSSFLYYRAMMQASNYVVLDKGKEVQIQRLNAQGITGENAEIISEPLTFENNVLYNAGMGFASFLMPAILILIIHQTLFFGIGMLAGTSREENRFHQLVSSSIHHGGTFRVIVGKSLCYLLMYVIFSFYILAVIPNIFNLPHIGNPLDIAKLMIPFLLATIFFSMTVSVFIPNRETGMIIFLFFSLIILFLSGISWPQSNINGFWKTFSWVFPAIHGIQGYIKINSMGATIRQVSYEYVSLWIQTIIYLLTATWAYRWQIKKSSNKQKLDQE